MPRRSFRRRACRGVAFAKTGPGDPGSAFLLLFFNSSIRQFDNSDIPAFTGLFFLAPLLQARRSGGEPLRCRTTSPDLIEDPRTPAASAPSGRRPQHSISLDFEAPPRDRHPTYIQDLLTVNKLSAGVPKPGQALSLVLSLGQQRKDTWFSCPPSTWKTDVQGHW
jgi:hypothetical protein